MARRIINFGIVVSYLFSAQLVLAGEPAAVVEDISPGVDGVEFMSYMEPGQSFKLNPGQSVTLGYLQSCIKESIDGGFVRVGKQQSMVIGGKVKRDRVECDGGKLILSKKQAGKSAITVFRGPLNAAKREGSANPQLTIFATSPIVSLTREAHSMTIERLDKKGLRLTLDVTTLVTDFAKYKIKLEPGGVYQLIVSDRELIFKVDPSADDHSESVLQRLVRL